MNVPKVKPELFFLKPTPYVPNSRLPIIVYRNVLSDTTPENILATIEPNKWLKGGQWKTYSTPHFHSRCHECYGIIRGETTYMLGKAPNDKGEFGMTLSVKAGDVFILPAGVSHASIDSRGDYEYIGLYPERTEDYDEAFDMQWCNSSPQETAALALVSARTPIPDRDPLYGLGGPLNTIWTEADLKSRDASWVGALATKFKGLFSFLLS